MTATTPATAPSDADEHVLNAAGEFEVHDQAVDLSVYRFEDWISFGFFWILALVIFYQFPREH